MAKVIADIAREVLHRSLSVVWAQGKAVLTGCICHGSAVTAGLRRQNALWLPN
jgi:hypothetical protein